MIVSYPFYCIDKNFEFVGEDLRGEHCSLFIHLINLHLGSKIVDVSIPNLISPGVHFKWVNEGKKLIVVNHKS